MAEKEYIEKHLLLYKILSVNSQVEQGIKYYNSVFNLILNTPTADVVEVKHGEWKLHPDGSGTCNHCGRTQKAVWDYDNAQNFCGHCGADMRGDGK